MISPLAPSDQTAFLERLVQPDQPDLLARLERLAQPDLPA